MSNPEALISEIDDEYWKIRRLIEGCYKQASGGSGLAERETIGLFEKTTGFQRFLESKQAQMKMFSGVSYYDRASTQLSKVLEMVTTPKTKKIVSGYYKSESGEFKVSSDFEVSGLTPVTRLLAWKSRGSSDYLLQQSYLEGAIDLLKDMELDLIELAGDIRLMSGLLMFPMEQRVTVSDGLLKLGFKEVVGFLDEATANLQLEPPHLKDSLANCRNAIESVVYTLAKKDSVGVANRFTIDLSEVSKKNPAIIDDATEAMIKGVYNYLSVKGSHVFGKVEKGNLEEVEFGFDQTYRVLDHILVRMKASKELK